MKHLIALILLTTLIFAGCSKSDPPLPAIKASFESSEQGIADEQQVTLKLLIDRSTDTDLAFEIDVTPFDLVYDEQFITEPAVSDGKIMLLIPAGSTETSFIVKKQEDAFFGGEEYIDFTVKPVSSAVIPGTNSTLKLSFGAIVSEGTSLRLNGGEGGASAVNSVFVDFSNNQQTSVLRSSWHLAFYAGDTYNVLLNGTKPLAAISTDATSIQSLTISDITPSALAIGQGQGSLELVDHWSHDFGQTVIAPVSATSSENKIYVIADAGAVGATPTADQLYKVKIDRSASGYTVQYAKINETTINTIEIQKNPQYNYQFLSLADKKVVNVEPEKAKWDIQWTYSVYYTSFGSGLIPYAFSDLVFINSKAGVKVAEVLTGETVSYETYTASNIATTDFVSDRDGIGSKWRVTSGSPLGVRDDRFYVVMDPAGNVYKLKFINFHSTAVDGGERGYPNIQYALVKKAD